MVKEFDLVELLRFCCGNLFVSFFWGGVGAKIPPKVEISCFCIKKYHRDNSRLPKHVSPRTSNIPALPLYFI